MSGSHARALPAPGGPASANGAQPGDVHQDVSELRRMVEQARAMPMSSSCVLSRPEALDLIGQLEEHLAQALRQATQVDAERAEILRRAQVQAEQIVADARSRRDDLVSDSEVFRLASTKAEQLVGEATEETQMLRRDTDDYVEGRLAALETSLQATLEAVTRGRSRLRGRNPLEELGRGSEGQSHRQGG